MKRCLILKQIYKKIELKSYLTSAHRSLGENDEKYEYDILNIKYFKAIQILRE